METSDVPGMEREDGLCIMDQHEFLFATQGIVLLYFKVTVHADEGIEVLPFPMWRASSVAHELTFLNRVHPKDQ